VERLSDLCTADGTFVLPSVAKGERSIRQSVSRLNDIKQERPGEQAWVVWRRFLNTICKNKEEQKENKNTITINNKDEESTKNKFSIGTLVTKFWSGIMYTGKITENTGKYYKIRYKDNDEGGLNHSEVRKYANKNSGEGRTTSEVGQRLRLQIPLGDWSILANESERLWPFYYPHDTDTLYRSYREEWHRNGEFYYNCHTMADNDTCNYMQSGNVKLLPKDASPTDVMDKDEGWRVSGHLPMVYSRWIPRTYL
jgi:hypothetical protein